MQISCYASDGLKFVSFNMANVGQESWKACVSSVKQDGRALTTRSLCFCFNANMLENGTQGWTQVLKQDKISNLLRRDGRFGNPAPSGIRSVGRSKKRHHDGMRKDTCG